MTFTFGSSGWRNVGLLKKPARAWFALFRTTHGSVTLRSLFFGNISWLLSTTSGLRICTATARFLSTHQMEEQARLFLRFPVFPWESSKALLFRSGSKVASQQAYNRSCSGMILTRLGR